MNSCLEDTQELGRIDRTVRAHLFERCMQIRGIEDFDIAKYMQENPQDTSINDTFDKAAALSEEKAKANE